MKSKKSTLDKEKHAQAEKISSQASSMLQKEKMQGDFHTCVQKEGEEIPHLPWATRILKLESGVFSCFANEKDMKDSKSCFSFRTADIETLMREPFSIGFFKGEVLHVLSIRSDETESTKWYNAIETSKNNSLLSNFKVETPEKPSKKSSAPQTPTSPSPMGSLRSKEEIESKARRIVSFNEQRFEEEQEKEKERAKMLEKQREEKLRKEREEEEEKKFSTDPIYNIWDSFLTEMKGIQEYVKMMEPQLRIEDFVDIFNNFNQVMDTAQKVNDCYRNAKKDSTKVKEFKDVCEELEAFAWFCSNKGQAVIKLKNLKQNSMDKKAIQEISDFFLKPTKAIMEFSEAIRKFVEENSDSNPDAQDFEEASAILQDVHDYIVLVVKMMSDWIETTENTFMKSFLTPAKRPLLFVETTTNYPIAIFTDFLIIFKTEEKDEETPSYSLHMKMPISLVEVEGTNKTTKINCPTLGLTCTINCLNNQSANILRRKILEVKSKLSTEQALKLVKVKSLPDKFPQSYCSIVVDDKLLVGTEEGIHYTYLTKNGNDFKQLPNTSNQRITNIKQSKLQLLIYSSQENTKKYDHMDGYSLNTYPIMSLDSFHAIQRHIFPSKVESNKIKLFQSFDIEKTEIFEDLKEIISIENLVITTSESHIFTFSQTKDSHLQLKFSLKQSEESSFIQYISTDIFTGSSQKLFKYNFMDNQIIKFFDHTSKNLPKDCLQYEEKFLSMQNEKTKFESIRFLIVCYEDHGIVINSESMEKVSELVWTEKANSFAFHGEYFLIFSDNYIEVRNKESIWQVKQVIASQQQNVINPYERYILRDKEIMKVTQLDQKDQEDVFKAFQETNKAIQSKSKTEMAEKRKSRVMKS